MIFIFKVATLVVANRIVDYSSISLHNYYPSIFIKQSTSASTIFVGPNRDGIVGLRPTTYRPHLHRPSHQALSNGSPHDPSLTPPTDDDQLTATVVPHPSLQSSITYDILCPIHCGCSPTADHTSSALYRCSGKAFQPRF